MQVPFPPFISTGDSAPAYWFLDALWLVHASGTQTNGKYSLIEQWQPEGSGPPPHAHPIEEVFFKIEGEMTVHIGMGKEEQIIVLGPGLHGQHTAQYSALV